MMPVSRRSAASCTSRSPGRVTISRSIYPLQVYGSRRGADYSIDQLSRFIDHAVRNTMEAVVIATPDTADPTAPAPGPFDLRAAMMRREWGPAASQPRE